MLDILQQGDYRIVHLTDGELLSEAVKLIDKGKADGINLNYIRNWRTDLEPLRNSKTIKFLAVNDYPPSMQYDRTFRGAYNSSTSHLSNQFKKLTGLTPSRFKQTGQQSRKSLDDVGSKK